MSKIIINGKSNGSLKAYLNGEPLDKLYVNGETAYIRMETGSAPAPAEPKYLCFTAEEANSTVKLQIPLGLNLTLYKSTDKQNWEAWDGSWITLSNVGDKVYLYGENESMTYYDKVAWSSNFKMTGRISASGDVTTLLTKNGTLSITSHYAFSMLFMNCTSLTTAPELPATTLEHACYYEMFGGCTSLTEAPELPATTLAESCYAFMFASCRSLTTAPVLPATTLAKYCYNGMFQTCTNLTTAPTLPVITAAYGCYRAMFKGCTSLTTAPQLPATTIYEECYKSMFEDCTSLTIAPELPATILSTNCYDYMFKGCTSLSTAPVIQSTSTAPYCYRGMFMGCTSLTTPPALQATSLVWSECYSYMFSGCTSLTTAPELPAVNLSSFCYLRMFQGCSTLSSVKIGSTSWNTSNSREWLSGAAASGTIYAPTGSEIANYSDNDSGVPSGWTVQYY